MELKTKYTMTPGLMNPSLARIVVEIHCGSNQVAAKRTAVLVRPSIRDLGRHEEHESSRMNRRKASEYLPYS